MSEAQAWTSEQRTALRTALCDNPFICDGGYIDFYAWSVVEDYQLALISEAGGWLKDLLRSVEREAAIGQHDPLQSTVERSLRGRGTGVTRRTVRTELERQGYTLCQRRGRVWLRRLQ